MGALVVGFPTITHFDPVVGHQLVLLLWFPPYSLPTTFALESVVNLVYVASILAHVQAPWMGANSRLNLAHFRLPCVFAFHRVATGPPRAYGNGCCPIISITCSSSQYQLTNSEQQPPLPPFSLSVHIHKLLHLEHCEAVYCLGLCGRRSPALARSACQLVLPFGPGPVVQTRTPYH